MDTSAISKTPPWECDERDFEGLDDAWNPKAHLSDEEPDWPSDSYSVFITFMYFLN